MKSSPTESSAIRNQRSDLGFLNHYQQHVFTSSADSIIILVVALGINPEIKHHFQEKDSSLPGLTSVSFSFLRAGSKDFLLRVMKPPWSGSIFGRQEPVFGIQSISWRLNVEPKSCSWHRVYGWFNGRCMRLQDWRWREKTHASSPSTSGKTYEKTSVIQTRPEQFDVFFGVFRLMVCLCLAVTFKKPSPARSYQRLETISSSISFSCFRSIFLCWRCEQEEISYE